MVTVLFSMVMISLCRASTCVLISDILVVILATGAGAFDSSRAATIAVSISLTADTRAARAYSADSSGRYCRGIADNGAHQ